MTFLLDESETAKVLFGVVRATRDIPARATSCSDHAQRGYRKYYMTMGTHSRRHSRVDFH